MSVDLMGKVFNCKMPELKTDKGENVPNSTAKFVLLALADHANEHGEGSYPSVKRLMDKTNLSSRTVCNALNALRTNGFTILEGRSRYKTNNYKILVAKIMEFQYDFSGYNSTVLAAKTESSLNHPLINDDKENNELIGDIPKCPDCKVEMVRRKNGDTEFWGCPNYKPKNCRQTADYPYYKQGSEADWKRRMAGWMEISE